MSHLIPRSVIHNPVHTELFTEIRKEDCYSSSWFEIRTYRFLLFFYHVVIVFKHTLLLVLLFFSFLSLFISNIIPPPVFRCPCVRIELAFFFLQFFPLQ